MQALKIIGNIFGILFAIVFSVVLVVVLLAIPPVKSLSAVFQPETIQDLAVNVLSSDIIEPGSAMSEGLEEMGLSEDIVQELMESDAVEDMLEVYLDDVFAASTGEYAENALTQEVLEDIVKDNKKELVSLLEEYGNVEDKEEAEELLDVIVEEHGEDIIEMLPSAEDNKISLEFPEEEGFFGAGNILRGLYTGGVMWILIGVAAVLCLLIFLCRAFKLQGFIWIGVSFGVAALLSAVVIMLANNMNLLMNMGFSQMERNIIGSIMPNMISAMVMAALVIAALAVVFIATYIIIKACTKKKVQRA